MSEDTASLVKAAQRGDTMAMSRLLSELIPYVRRVCGPIALDEGADAAQEALLAIFTNLRSLRDPAALYGWVRVIAVREAVRVARRAGRTVTTDRLEHVPSRDDIEQAVDVRDVLARLTPEHRAILMLRDVEDMTEADAAAILHLPDGTAKSRLHRARENFRKAWKA